MAAATVAVYGPPISTHVFHEIGIVKSLQKLAMPMQSMAGTTALTRVKTSNRIAVLRNPAKAMVR